MISTSATANGTTDPVPTYVPMDERRLMKASLEMGVWLERYTGKPWRSGGPRRKKSYQKDPI